MKKLAIVFHVAKTTRPSSGLQCFSQRLIDSRVNALDTKIKARSQLSWFGHQKRMVGFCFLFGLSGIKYILSDAKKHLFGSPSSLRLPNRKRLSVPFAVPLSVGKAPVQPWMEMLGHPTSINFVNNFSGCKCPFFKNITWKRRGWRHIWRGRTCWMVLTSMCSHAVGREQKPTDDLILLHSPTCSVSAHVNAGHLIGHKCYSFIS